MNDNLTIQRVWTRLSHQFMRRTSLKPLANGRNIVGCYMVRPSAHPATCCYIRLCFVGSCCSKFKTFEPTISPNISFVPRSRKRSTTWWIHLHSSSNIVEATHAHYIYGFQSIMGCILPPMDFTGKFVGSCCILLHTTANTGAITVKIVGPTMLGVVASVCTYL